MARPEEFRLAAALPQNHHHEADELLRQSRIFSNVTSERFEVLIDQDSVRKRLGDSQLWKFFDLGHGYCTYLPKQSGRAQMPEAQGNLLRLRQDIPLQEPELAAIDEGITAYDRLVDSLQDIAPQPYRLRAS